jgi:hypothetical protein
MTRKGKLTEQERRALGLPPCSKCGRYNIDGQDCDVARACERRRHLAMRGMIIANLLDEDEKLSVGLALAHWVERGTDGRSALRKLRTLLTALQAAYAADAEQLAVSPSAARKAWRTRRARANDDRNTAQA